MISVGPDTHHTQMFLDRTKLNPGFAEPGIEQGACV